ncbi:MAG TPA: response regulator [Candidatus Saccharimonadales bacterium]
MNNPPQPHQLKVVIVEDNVPLADIYKTRLELIGYKCFVAYDGNAALDTIQREVPDLVLLDLMVPEVAGDQILKRMRDSDWGKNIRVFIISNLNEVDAPRGLRDLGIEGYVVKANLANDQLDQLVDNILKPEGQTESTSLEEQTIVAHDEQPEQDTSPEGPDEFQPPHAQPPEQPETQPEPTPQPHEY